MFDPKKHLSQEKIEQMLQNRCERELCFLLLVDVIGSGSYSNLALKKADKTARKTGIPLNFVRAMFYGTLTYLYSIDQIFHMITKKNMDDLDIVSSVVIRQAIWQMLFSDSDIPSYAIVSTAVDLVKKYNPKASGLVNALLRQVSSADDEVKDIDRYNPNIKTSLKPEIFGILKKSYGQEKALAIGKALLSPSMTTLRFDPGKISSEDLIKDLERSGIDAAPGYFMPCALLINGSTPGIENTEAYKNGLVSVQNEAAQLASFVAAPQVGFKILDVCSAPGGKSCHMAEIAHDDCSIEALDLSQSRLELVKQNADRLGLKSISVKCADSTDLSDFRDSYYDIVLCDLPCSGLGLMGRKPDIRLNMTFEKICDIRDIQRKILDEASSKVRPGGALIYCTCTLNADENEGQMTRFLADHGEYKAADISALLPVGLSKDPDRTASSALGYVTLFPDTDKVDGFFISRMERIL